MMHMVYKTVHPAINVEVFFCAGHKQRNGRWMVVIFVLKIMVLK